MRLHRVARVDEVPGRGGLVVAVNGVEIGIIRLGARLVAWRNVCPHFGAPVCRGTVTHLMWRMDKNYKALRDTTPWLKRLPSEYIVEHVRLTTQPIEEPANRDELAQVLATASMPRPRSAGHRSLRTNDAAASPKTMATHTAAHAR